LATTTGVGITTIEATAGPANGSTLLTVAPLDFSLTGSLKTARTYHTATLLNNGLVLVAGGYAGGVNNLPSAELYNPSTGTFTPTGSLNNERYQHTATLLNNGLVLIAGGYHSGALASAELYDPATGTFSYIGNLNIARYEHTATLLSNGMVLIAGGDATCCVSGYQATAELYNPATGTFTLTGNMTTQRVNHTATLLNNGMVLMAGGQNSSGIRTSAELYNPATGTFTLTGSLTTARFSQTATLLNNGLALLAGGEGSSALLASAELYNPTSGTFTLTGSLNTARGRQTATLLNNGTVLMAGGIYDTNGDATNSAELYNPAAGTFSLTGSLNTARDVHTATLLNDGMVLVAGGYNGAYLASAELFEPATLTPPNLVSISLNPSSPTLPLDTAQRFTATGTFGDSSTQQLASVTWSSSNTAVVSITGDASNLGAAYAFAAGPVTVSACTGRRR
jgi:hypothetical protein